jgi:hypothetical protein
MCLLLRHEMYRARACSHRVASSHKRQNNARVPLALRPVRKQGREVIHTFRSYLLNCSWTNIVLLYFICYGNVSASFSVNDVGLYVIIRKLLDSVELGYPSRYSDGLDGGSSIPGRGKVFFSSPKRPDRLWGPLSLLSNGYWGLFFLGQNGRVVNLTTHLHLSAEVKKGGAIPPLPPYVFIAYCLIN